MPDSTTLAPLSVVAVVQFNDGEALVLNRPLQLTYERVGNDYIGSDGPFRDALVFSRGSGRFVAFAGRELTIPMKDGTTKKLKDHWWSGSMDGYRQCIRSDVQSLKRCYVFSNALCEEAALVALRSAYEGCVFPYWDYEKAIKDSVLDVMAQSARAAVQSVIDKAAARHLAAMASTWSTPCQH